MNTNYIVKTDRLNIYPYSDQEIEGIIKEEEDDDMRQAYSEMLDGCRMYPEQRIWYAVWNMERNDGTKRSIGDLSFKGVDSEGMVEIGYGIKPKYEGQGYMTEAVIAMASWASNQIGVNRVEAETTIENIVSKRVLEKAGFRLNGVVGTEGPRYTYKKL